MNTYAERVARGAAFLDQEYGRGWEDRIDLESFDITDPCGCILGQLEGGYWTACKTLGLDSQSNQSDPFELGFSDVDESNNLDPATAWEQLETEWVKLLQTRRVAA